VSFDVLSDLNWLAVIVAGVVYYALGAVWYSTGVFGKTWMRSIGWNPEKQPEMSAADYALPFVGYLVAAIAIGMLAAATGSTTFCSGVVLGLVIGIGIAAVMAFVTARFDPMRPEPMTWFWVTAGYHVIGILEASVVIAVWQ
jgi:hypothetical protein